MERRLGGYKGIGKIYSGDCMRLWLLALVFGFFSSLAFAGNVQPPCLGENGQPLTNSVAQVLKWKESTPNQFKARALISGVIVGTTLDRNSHLQLEVDLTPQTSNDRDVSEHIEMIYNKEFGEVTDFRPGLPLVACGDYITSTAKAGGYPASPMGAIIHWVHMSPNPAKHPSGFLMINGVLYGQNNPNDRQN